MNLQPKRNPIKKSFIPLMSLLLIFILCKMKQNIPAQETIEQKIISLEREALDQWSQGNPLGFAKHMADDVTYFDDIGASNRLNSAQECKAYLESLAGQIPSHTYKMVDPMVQAYDKVAILTFQYHSKIDTVAGPPWKATSVYRMKDDKWQMVHANWSLVKGQ